MFKKENLKVGMVIEMHWSHQKDTSLYVVTEDSLGNLIAANKVGYTALTDMEGDLDDKRGSYVTKVYSRSRRSVDQINTNLDARTLLWERKNEKKEMTIAEIEKELGYAIKIVRKKED